MKNNNEQEKRKIENRYIENMQYIKIKREMEKENLIQKEEYFKKMKNLFQDEKI